MRRAGSRGKYGESWKAPPDGNCEISLGSFRDSNLSAKDLDAEVGQCVAWVGARGSLFVPDRPEEDERVVQFPAHAQVEKRRVLARRDGFVELDQAFDVLAALVRRDRTERPLVRAILHEVAADFRVEAEAGRLRGRLDRQEEFLARSGDAALDRRWNGIPRKLRVCGDVEAGALLVDEAPLHAHLRRARARLPRLSRIAGKHPGNVELELDVVAPSV